MKYLLKLIILLKLSKIIKYFFSRLGFKIISSDVKDFAFTLSKILKIYNINLILDVGANVGQFCQKIIELNYKNKIILVEPVKETFLKLKEDFKGKTNLEFLNVGIGTQTSQQKIYKSLRNNNKADMNSLLKINNTGEKLVKNANITSEEIVEIVHVNEFLKNYNLNNSMLKIDTEGFDFQILKNIKIEYLKKINIIMIEVGAFKIFDSQEGDLNEITEFCKKNNFQLYNIDPFFINPATGQLCIMDILFVNKDIKPNNLDKTFKEKIGHPEIFI